jgi:hypothetical protein
MFSITGHERKNMSSEKTSESAPVDCSIHLPRSVWFFHAAKTMLNPVLKRCRVFADVEYQLSVSWSGDPTTFEMWSNGLTRENVLGELEMERARHPERAFRVEAVLTFTAYGNLVR